MLRPRKFVHFASIKYEACLKSTRSNALKGRSISARDIARERRKQIRNGIDPLEQKKHDKENSLIQQRNAKTFRECAQVVIENKARELKNSRQSDFWRTNLEKYVFPTLGDRIIGTITRADVAAVLEPVWQTKHKTAKEMRGRIETVLDYAKAMEYLVGKTRLHCSFETIIPIVFD